MSSIVLSASVRQNLLSLQSTASLLATTQNDLATGNKVNSALDNPTNYFTAQSLNNRAGDIGNLLDSIGNGVQILQAANTGITSLQSLVASGQSIANQVLQQPVGYSQKASVVSATITNGGVPVTADDLRGTGTTGTSSTGTAVNVNFGPSTTSTKLSTLWPSPISTSDGVLITTGSGSNTIQFDSTTGNQIPPSGTSHLDLSTATVGDFIQAAEAATGDSWSLNAQGQLVDDATQSTTIQASNTSLGFPPGSNTFGSGTNTFSGIADSTSHPIQGYFWLGTLGTALTTSDTLSVGGKDITFNNGSGTTISANGASIDLSSGASTYDELLSAIDTITGTSTPSTITNGQISLSSSAGTYNISGTALAKLGLSGVSTVGPTGQTLSFGAVGDGTATTVTFGDGTNGTVKSLNDLNNALAADNLQATLDASGRLTIETNNDNASQSISVSGTAVTDAAGAFNTANHATVTTSPVADPNSQASRAALVAQYNNVLAQINTTAQDASFNGVNLLGGDTLKLTFDETGKSALSITGVTFNDAGLGLSSLSQGTDFLDSASATKTLNALNSASSTLRAEASTLGSNLSIVQIRQDFNKNMIDVLQTGSSNLTLADTNVLAADSQALSTRQSIAVSALALANQSQSSVLQLLR